MGLHTLHSAAGVTQATCTTVSRAMKTICSSMHVDKQMVCGAIVSRVHPQLAKPAPVLPAATAAIGTHVAMSVAPLRAGPYSAPRLHMRAECRTPGRTPIAKSLITLLVRDVSSRPPPEMTQALLQSAAQSALVVMAWRIGRTLAPPLPALPSVPQPADGAPYAGLSMSSPPCTTLSTTVTITRPPATGASTAPRAASIPGLHLRMGGLVVEVGALMKITSPMASPGNWFSRSAFPAPGDQGTSRFNAPQRTRDAACVALTRAAPTALQLAAYPLRVTPGVAAGARSALVPVESSSAKRQLSCARHSSTITVPGTPSDTHNLCNACKVLPAIPVLVLPEE